MNWHSETAVLWLPKDRSAYPAEFAVCAAPGSRGFFYYALDAFASIFQRVDAEADLKPWAYMIDDQMILAADQIQALRPEWKIQMKLASQGRTIAAK